MEEEMIAALEAEFGGLMVERDESYDMDGMLGFDVEGDKYIVGDYDTAYEAAVKDAIRTFEDCYDDADKVDWLKRWNWPGVDTDTIMSDIAMDYDYEEDGNPYEDMDFEEYCDEMGECPSYGFIQNYINFNELGKFVVDTDGIANGLARYDGNEIDCGDFLAFRVD